MGTDVFGSFFVCDDHCAVELGSRPGKSINAAVLVPPKLSILHL